MTTFPMAAAATARGSCERSAPARRPGARVHGRPSLPRQAEIGAWVPVVSKPFDLGEIERILDAVARKARSAGPSSGRVVWARARPDPDERVPAGGLRRSRDPRRRADAPPSSAHRRRRAELREPLRGRRSLARPRLRPGHDASQLDPRLRPMIEALSRDISMLTDPVRADVVHAHTWYTHLAGVLAQKAYGIPLAVTVHSLEPLRPWKREQLGGGYDVSSWVERTAIESARAVIAVSNGTREDVLRLFDVPPERVHVIHNGIDADYYRPDRETTLPRAARHRPERAVRPLRRAGDAAEGDRPPRPRHPPPRPRASASSSAPDSRTRPRSPARWPRASAPPRPSDRTSSGSARWSAARRCASSTRTRRSSAAHRSTSRSGSSTWRRPPARRRSWHPRSGASRRSSWTGRPACWCRSSCRSTTRCGRSTPDRFELNLAGAINALMADARTRVVMGRAARRRAVQHFSWDVIARQTVALYRTMIG